MSEKHETENIETNAESSEEAEVQLSELEQNVWSVIGFDRCFASNLTYDEALEQISKLSDEKPSGLCIVTDEAAGRMGRDKRVVI